MILIIRRGKELRAAFPNSNASEAVALAGTIFEDGSVDGPLPLSGRSCGRCSLCCKVPEIKELGKPHDQWCNHCEVGKGCRIYEDRPAVCRGFYCDWLIEPMVGEHWFPARSKMVLLTEPDGSRLVIYVDSSRPNAWREQPYYNEIKEWATRAAQHMRQVMICVGDRSIVVLPDRDVDLGHVAENERIVTSEFMEGGRRRMKVTKVRADDPSLAGVRIGEISTRTL